MKKNAIFIAATGQNVGKTTICLGLISGLKKRFPNLGFMKPVGQQHLTVQNKKVDKDVVLFKEHFQIPFDYEKMSPVIVPRGFTKDYLDGKHNTHQMIDKIQKSFQDIDSASDFTIVEGTGHVGVGSIFNLNNAQVAAHLGLDVIMTCSGGLGSSFDELSLNKAICDSLKIKIRGVILNKVIDQKKESTIAYMKKALARWNIPLIGSVPFNRLLNTPSMEDFQSLFETELLSGKNYLHKHFENTRLVATSVDTFKEVIVHNQLLITPATREDIIHAVIESQHHMISRPSPKEPGHGLILTGRHPPTPTMIQKLIEAQIPSLYASLSSYDAMKKIASFTAKIRFGDHVKIQKAIELVENHLDFDWI